MRVYVLPFSLLAFTFVISANAQTVSAPRDATALATLQTAVVTLSGNNLAGIQNCVVQGQVKRNDSSVGQFKWENSGPDFHYEETVNSVTSMVVSNHGSPASEAGTAVMHFPPHFTATLFPRPLIVLILNQYASDVTVGLATSTSGSSNGTKVEVTFPESSDPLARKTQLEWTFDPQSGLPTKVHQWVPGYPIANFISQSDTYLSSYNTLGGVLVPTHIDEYSGQTL